MRMRTISTCASRTMRSEATSLFDSPDAVRITVNALRTQNEGAEIMVQLSAERGTERESRTLILTAEQYLELRPERGEISEETYERLKEASELCAAIRAGESLLSYASNSVQMLSKKLMGKGYSRTTALAAAQILAARGMINEERDLSREVERSLSKLWGPKRITEHLWSRGFGQAAMEHLPAVLEGIDFAETCVELIEKRYVSFPSDPAERRKMISFLSRYGYPIGIIREALRRAFGTDGEDE